MDQIGTELVRRELKVIPAKAVVIEYHSVNYGCKNCKEHGITPTIIKGKDGKAHMMYGMASVPTAAWVVYQKYCNGMPLYRIEQELRRLGAKISRATLANWVIKNTDVRDGMIIVNKSEKYNRDTKEYWIGATKNGKERYMPLTDEIIKLLVRV